MEDASSAFETPARRPRQRVSAGSATGSRGGSSLLGTGTESELTPGGAQILHAGLQRSARALALQVLGVYRYVADLALRRVLPRRAADALEWDVFDLVVSDGQMKMKAILSPALNHLVWRGLVGELDIVEIDDYEIIHVPLSEHDDGDDESNSGTARSQQTREVCVIHDLAPRAPAVAVASDDVSAASQLNVTPRAKIVYSVGPALLASPSPSLVGGATGDAVPDVQFISEAHIRDHGALPLAGARLYYLSLFSDDYPAEWEPVQKESLSPVSLALPWAEWNRRRRYCTDIFTSSDRTLHMIREVNVMTSSKKRGASQMEHDGDEPSQPAPPPPMIGVVRFKSSLVHVGSPKLANPFPFMFHIVLSDRERSVEIAFFGSMAAKNFLVVQEGDLIQLQGYTISHGMPRPDKKKPRKLFVFPHMSTGVVSHVPDKYWPLLETMKILEKRPRKSVDANDKGERVQHQEPSRLMNQPSVWLHPTFLTAVEILHPDLFLNLEGEEEAKSEDTYFDFVGVVSFVGRMHRHRPQRDGSNADTAEFIRAYRWVKLIDSTSKVELIVRLHANSQPTGFHAIQAGDIAMLSKLQWVSTHKDPVGLDFASSSVYTTIRLNDDVEPFQVFVECSDAFAFAKQLQATGGIKTMYSAVDSPLVATTESWLDGDHVYNYQPLHSAASMSDCVVESLAMLRNSTKASFETAQSHWIPSFNPGMSIPHTEHTGGIGYNYPFDEVHAIAESMDAMSHRYIRVHVALHDIRTAPSTKNIVPDIEFLVTDGEIQDRPPQPIRLRANLLFKQPELPSPLDEMVAAEAESLARLLAPGAVESLNTTSILRSTELPQFSPAKTSVASLESEQQEITLDTVKEYILKSRNGAEPGRVGGIDAALHLYRMPHGELDFWIDSISL